MHAGGFALQVQHTCMTVNTIVQARMGKLFYIERIRVLRMRRQRPVYVPARGQTSSNQFSHAS